jgi:hypothetical protein
MHLGFIQPHAKYFGCVHIHYEGKWEGCWALEFECFWALWNGIEPIRECHLGPYKLEILIGAPYLRVHPGSLFSVFPYPSLFPTFYPFFYPFIMCLMALPRLLATMNCTVCTSSQSTALYEVFAHIQKETLTFLRMTWRYLYDGYFFYFRASWLSSLVCPSWKSVLSRRIFPRSIFHEF